jgi:6-phosphofructokinase 1
MKIFLSYHFPDEMFLLQVSYYLRKQPGLDPFLWGEDPRKNPSWVVAVEEALQNSQAFVFFRGSELGVTQQRELDVARQFHLEPIGVHLPRAPERDLLRDITVTTQDAAGALDCAKEIVRALRQNWIPVDGLPDGYPFEYEKSIIEAYAGGDFKARKVDEGCPDEWPQVERYEAKRANRVPQDTIGKYRPLNAEVMVDARIQSLPAKAEGGDSDPRSSRLTFPEAGPREKLRFPEEGNTLTVGLLVSGGIAPGINSVIEGIVSRHALYQEAQNKTRHSRYNLQVFGYLEGFEGLLRPGENYKMLTVNDVRGKGHLGGSILGTSRAGEFLDPDPQARENCMQDILNKLAGHGADILYIIGGDGSIRAAHAISVAAKRRRQMRNLSVVAIPKSTDNDILWTWQSFGFLSAVNEAVNAIMALSTEIKSNPRLCVLQLFGSDSGFVVSHAALGSGAGMCDAALIPEVPFSLKTLSSYIRQRLNDRYKPGADGERPYGMIVMAETAIPTDVCDYIDDKHVGLYDEEKEAIRTFVSNKRRVRGQTPDALRTGGLKVVSRVLQRDIQNMRGHYWKTFRVFTNEPRHLIRAVAPGVSDVISGQRLGILAVDNAMAGYTSFMVSQWLTEYVLVPLSLVVLGRKRVPQEGIFWKSVLAMTGQPSEMA